jgi:lysozyme
VTPFLADDIKAAEGLRLRAYPDVLSGGAPFTIGWGHAGLDVHPGLEWTEEQAEVALAADIATAINRLDRNIPWWRGLCDARQDVLVNLCFNMGWGDRTHGLSSFKHTLEAIRLDLFSAAAEGLLASKWAGQVGSRATRLAEQMRTGVRVAP